MRLNLGCGDDIRPDYINVDFRKTHPSVVQVDLSRFPWSFEDNSAEEILMLDFLEHFPYAQTKAILLECRRVLRFDGTVVIQVPDALQTCRALIQEGEYTCNKCETPVVGRGHKDWDPHCGTCGQDADVTSEAAMRRLYGGQDYAGNFHQTCFTRGSLEGKAEECGLELIGYEEEQHMWRNWTLKARFKVGELW